MADTIDEITLNWKDEEGRLVRKEINKEILTRGAWTTILFLYEEMNRQSGEYAPPKVSIRRYKKGPSGYRDQSRFNISNAKQAHQIIDVLKKWFPEDPRENEDKKK